MYSRVRTYLVAALASFTFLVHATLERVWDWLVSAFLPVDVRFDDSGLAPALGAAGFPLDPALQHSLRHEAGYGHRAAARHI